MRMMSFALTERQLMDGSKTVTRRTGWADLEPGTRITAVRKSMGLKKGEKAVVLCEIEVVDVGREALSAITWDDVIAEGEPWGVRSVAEFVERFCKHMRIPAREYIGPKYQAPMRPMRPDDLVTRIEFRKMPGSERVPVQEGLSL